MNSKISSGFSLLPVLFLVLLVLKLTGHIDWSWWMELVLTYTWGLAMLLCGIWCGMSFEREQGKARDK